MANQVYALVAHQPRDHGHHRNRPIVQTENLLQLFFALGLVLRKTVRVEVCRKIGIRSRVVAFDVDTIEDAAQLILLLAQQVVQAVAVPGVKYLACIAGRNRRHLVRALNGAFHEVDTAVILHQVRVLPSNGQRILQDLHAVFALILDVMDREHGFDAAVLLQMSVIQVQIYGHQRRLPIVGVDDVGDEVHMKQHLQNGAGEKRKPLAVIVKAVQSSSFKIVFIVQKVIFYAVVRQFKQAAILVAPAYGNRKICDIG